MKKDEIESLKSSLNKANEKIVSLQGDVEAYKLSGEQMGNEIKALKRQVGGYKTSNANYRRTIESLKMDVNGLAEKLRVSEKNFNEIALINTTIRTERDELNRKVTILNEEIEDLKKPWWKRIF